MEIGVALLNFQRFIEAFGWTESYCKMTSVGTLAQSTYAVKSLDDERLTRSLLDVASSLQALVSTQLLGLGSLAKTLLSRFSDSATSSSDIVPEM
jgi:hypothetical protein